MRKIGFVIAIFGFALGARADVVVDATSTRVDIPKPPVRIITLAPALAELAAEILGPDLERIVGVSERTDYPPALKEKPQVGSYVGFDLERILQLKPDLVLATMDGNPRDKILRLRELGIPTVVVETTSFPEILNAFELTARALHRPAVGQALAAQLQKGLDRFRARAQVRGKRPRVMLQIGADPLVVAGRRSFLNEALEVLGAENVYGDLNQGYPRPAVEDVLKRNPDQIVIVSMGHEKNDVNSGLIQETRKWKQYPRLKAVQSGQVKVLEGDTLLRPSMRLLEGLSLLERALFGEWKG